VRQARPEQVAGVVARAADPVGEVGQERDREGREVRARRGTATRGVGGENRPIGQLLLLDDAGVVLLRGPETVQEDQRGADAVVVQFGDLDVGRADGEREGEALELVRTDQRVSSTGCLTATAPPPGVRRAWPRTAGLRNERRP
jgi:hypothetical protein